MDAPITADYVLAMAERIEHNGQQFYLMAAERLEDPGRRQLLLELADMEARHRETFSEMRQRLAAGAAGETEIDPDGDTAAYLRTLLDGTFFDVEVTPADYLRGDESRQAILQTAIGLEKETVVFYEGVRRVLSGKQDEAALEAILREEMGHISALAGALGLYDA